MSWRDLIFSCRRMEDLTVAGMLEITRIISEYALNIMLKLILLLLCRNWHEQCQG
jgi:hypothetical protein